MSRDKITNLVNLVALLEGDSPVAWSEVRRLVRGFPGWERLVELMLDPPLPTKGGQFFPQEGFNVSSGMRQKLLETLQPYAILVSMESSPIECAALLERNTGVNAVAFCKQCVHDNTPEIADSARIVLEACRNQETLMRGVHSTSGPNSVAPPQGTQTRQSWFHRWLKKS